MVMELWSVDGGERDWTSHRASATLSGWSLQPVCCLDYNARLFRAGSPEACYDEPQLEP
jgi:hypothetical protein